MSLAFNGFTATIPGQAAYSQLTMPSWTLAKISTAAGTGNFPAVATMRFYTTAQAATLPAWLQPGCAVKIAAVYSGADVGGSYTVRAVDPNGTWFEVVPRAHARLVTAVASPTALDAGSWSATLIAICQKAMIVVPSSAGSAVNMSPNAMFNGTAPGQVTPLPNNGTEYELMAPGGAKFDLADLWFQAGSQSSVQIRFI